MFLLLLFARIIYFNYWKDGLGLQSHKLFLPDCGSQTITTCHQDEGTTTYFVHQTGTVQTAEINNKAGVVTNSNHDED